MSVSSLPNLAALRVSSQSVLVCAEVGELGKTTGSPIIDLRRASDLDEPLVERIFLRAGREMITAARGHWDEERERLQFREQLDLDSTWIVRHGDVDVGFMMVVVQPDLTELHTLCILPEWQEQGLGSKFVRDLVTEASARGQKIELQVLKTNTRARSFYERLGFRVIAELPHHHRMRFG
jgi:ribosomal protein S18 acetylase RimI-like enzyme